MDNRWVPKGESSEDASKLIWSTKSINELLLALDQGYRPSVSMPFYEGKQFLRRGNISPILAPPLFIMLATVLSNPLLRVSFKKSLVA